MPRGRPRGRGRGGWRCKRKADASENDESTTSATNNEQENIDESIKGCGDTSQSDNNEQIDGDENQETTKEDLSIKPTPKKRGRKRKSEIPQEDRYLPSKDPAQRGIMAQGGSLRRRDTLKSSWRYSPPPVTTRRSKLAEKPQSETDNDTSKQIFPIAYTITIENKSKKPCEKTKASSEDKKMIVTMPDGFPIKVEPPGKKMTVQKKTTNSEQKPAEKSDLVQDKDPEKVEQAREENIEKEDKDVDSELKPRARVIRRKSTETPNNVTVAAGSADKPKTLSSFTVTTSVITNEKIPVMTTAATAPVTMSKTQTITISSNTQSVGVSKVSTPVSSTTSLTSKLPTILKPPLTSTPTASNVAKSPSVRKPISLSKYLETLPEIDDCIHNDGIPDAHMEKMPDKILLVHSELPLPLAVSIDNENENYLFRQIISPVNATRFVCLLCKGIDVNFGTKEEKDILLHYQSLHELDVDIGQAKFSDDIVFICLPKMILNQFNNSSNLSLNSPCQYCDIRLSDISEMKEHYSVEHNKEVIMMEQEEIMQMHHYFYCCKCKEQSPDFDTHHKHMKTHHNLKTYRCKSCVLVTKDENRLRTHFKAKHMLHSSGQNYQCYYCHGLLIGVERLQKHIQQSHMVQTGSSDYSCVACRQSCGKGKELLTHAQNCSLAGIKPEKSEIRFVPNLDYSPTLMKGECICYFCNVKLDSEDAYQLHLHHEHKKWVPDPNAESSTLQKVVENQNSDEIAIPKGFLTIDDVISDDDLKRAKIKTYVGHWCRMCDQMVKVYQLYYLHMVNYHKLEKMYQCVIIACKKTFREFEEFKQHIEESGHVQKTIISHPDEVFVCAYCDIYFASDEELTTHLITDQHINKFTASGHFHRTEPRNFKCKACYTYFGMKESYIHHLETESHQYVCTYCGITTATPSSRRAHIQNSHAEKLLLCEDCGECQNDIMAHFVLHGYTFECKKCIKKFYNRERLNAHMEVHQDPIECNWPDCNRMIATRSMLVTHYRGHKSEHKCTVCGQAFWNFAMLTSHLRSHQPMPRTPQSAAKANQGKATIQYQNQTRSSPSVLQRPKLASQPLLSNSVIKCGHCNNLFRSTKDLSIHKCIEKFSNNGDQSKLLELASKATAQAKAVNKTPPRKRASPKKAQPVEQLIDFSSFQTSIEQQQVDDDTQLIMILNQSTGELMEITAPKGMEVQDVINSLSFTSGIEDVQMEGVDEQSQQQVLQIAQAGEQQSNKAKADGQNDQEETAAAIEIIEQVNDQSANVVDMENESSNNQEVSNNAEVLMQDNGDQITQIIETDQNSQEQAIVLPPDCINEDGSLTLDAETLQRLNLAISVDENGTITTRDGNATFIIDTSIKE